jgi:hypothetical protein
LNLISLYNVNLHPVITSTKFNLKIH